MCVGGGHEFKKKPNYAEVNSDSGERTDSI